MELLEAFTKSDNPIISLLAIMVMGLVSVVVYQWKYTSSNTVPKWVWDGLLPKVEKILEVQERLLVILDERLKK
jgi:hypothetical protein